MQDGSGFLIGSEAFPPCSTIFMYRSCNCFIKRDLYVYNIIYHKPMKANFASMGLFYIMVFTFKTLTLLPESHPPIHINCNDEQWSKEKILSCQSGSLRGPACDMNECHMGQLSVERIQSTHRVSGNIEAGWSSAIVLTFRIGSWQDHQVFTPTTPPLDNILVHFKMQFNV